MTTGPFTPEPGDEVGAEQLRQVLTQAAAPIQPSDGSLGRVLTRANQRSPWSWGAPLLAAAAALVLVAGASVYVGTHGTTSAQPGSHSPSSSTLPSQTATGPSPTDSAHSSPTGTGSLVALPVYYAGSFNGQTRLYREFHRVRSTDHAVDAVTQALTTAPDDPDYRTLWKPGTTVLGYSTQGALAFVRLSSPPVPMSTIALQQLVYTITAADTSVHKVLFAYGLSAAFGGPVSRGATIDTLATVWLLQPTQGATVSSPVTLSGTAMVFEATMNWEIDTPDGTMVTSGNAMTPQAFVQGPWSTTVSLPPGHYVALAFEASAKDGSKTWIDSKPFTVH
jgi:hypothetical protein